MKMKFAFRYSHGKSSRDKKEEPLVKNFTHDKKGGSARWI